MLASLAFPFDQISEFSSFPGGGQGGSAIHNCGIVAAGMDIRGANITRGRERNDTVGGPTGSGGTTNHDRTTRVSGGEERREYSWGGRK